MLMLSHAVIYILHKNPGQWIHVQKAKRRKFVLGQFPYALPLRKQNFI